MSRKTNADHFISLVLIAYVFHVTVELCFCFVPLLLDILLLLMVSIHTTTWNWANRRLTNECKHKQKEIMRGIYDNRVSVCFFFFITNQLYVLFSFWIFSLVSFSTFCNQLALFNASNKIVVALNKDTLFITCSSENSFFLLLLSLCRSGLFVWMRCLPL